MVVVESINNQWLFLEFSGDKQKKWKKHVFDQKHFVFYQKHVCLTKKNDDFWRQAKKNYKSVPTTWFLKITMLTINVCFQKQCFEKMWVISCYGHEPTNRWFIAFNTDFITGCQPIFATSFFCLFLERDF